MVARVEFWKRAQRGPNGRKTRAFPEDDREMENALDALALAAYGALNSGKIPEPFRTQLKAAADRALRALGANPIS